MKTTAKWKTLGAVCLAAMLVSTACSESSASPAAENLPVVKTWKVASVSTGLTVTGKISPAEEIQVVSKVSGKIASVAVKEGSVAKQGDVLVTLEASDYQDQIAQAEAAIAGAQAKLRDTKAGTRSQQLQQLASTVEQAEASLRVAESQYQRMKALYDSGALSQAELEKVELELEKARTGLAQAKAQYDLAKEGPTPDTVAALEAEVERLNASLAMAKNGLANTQITAPISGVIAKRNVDPGEMATAGAPLLVLVKMDEVQVEASVPQERINQFAAGTEVDVRVIGEDGKVRKGKVEFVSPVADANSSSFPVKVRLDNRDGSLRAGMVAEISLAGEIDQGIRVPSSAVVSKDGKQYVFTVEGDIVHQKEVSVSQTEGNWAVVSSGVTEGEQLVLNPTDSLSEGSKVIAN